MYVVCTDLCMYGFMYVCMYLCTYVICTYVHMYVPLYLCMCATAQEFGPFIRDKEPAQYSFETWDGSLRLLCMYNARRIAAGRVQGFRVQGLGNLEGLQRGLVQKGFGV